MTALGSVGFPAWLGPGFLQANALLSSGGTYSEAMALVEKTLELRELDLLLDSRAKAMREAYEFVGLSSESALANTVTASFPVVESPCNAIRQLADKLAEASPEEPVQYAAIQIHLAQLLRSALADEGQTTGYSTLIIEQSISIIEITALGRLPEDTLLGDGDATAGERLGELYSELEAYTQMRSKADSNLREASEEMLSDFFRVWRTYGSTAAVKFAADL